MVAVGGLEPRGASGLVRDLLTIRSLAAEPFLIPTAYTLQSETAVDSVELRPEDGLRQALAMAVALGDGRPVAVKVGMVGSGTLVRPLVEGLVGFAGPVVYDPVLAASSGGALYVGPLSALSPLIARATLVTPNLAEAGALTGTAVTDLEGARAAARLLLDAGARAVLVKGGHLPGAAEDLLVSAAGEQLFSLPRVEGKSPRGTGCALASAIAVELARGRPLPEAVASAKHWLRERIAAARPVDNERWL